ncbi:MAG: hypothetical protein ACRDF9_09385 [Candidatus Limnocylindria bacterium]
MPQYFLAGIFSLVAVLPRYLDVVSRIPPTRYAVDLMRDAYYADRPEAPRSRRFPSARVQVTALLVDR